MPTENFTKLRHLIFRRRCRNILMQNLNMLNAYNAKQHSFMNGEYTAVINKNKFVQKGWSKKFGIPCFSSKTSALRHRKSRRKTQGVNFRLLSRGAVSTPRRSVRGAGHAGAPPTDNCPGRGWIPPPLPEAEAPLPPNPPPGLRSRSALPGLPFLFLPRQPPLPR